MILGNIEIVRCIKAKKFSIENLASMDPYGEPFNTSAVDLRLGDEILVPKKRAPIQIDLTDKEGIAKHLKDTSESVVITRTQPYSLEPYTFVLGKTKEVVSFPIIKGANINYSARVEGKSSAARYGLIVHFTAPTIHAGFDGSITLEMINLGPHSILLKPEMYICQLVIEVVQGRIFKGKSTFRGQRTVGGSPK
jgi:dCTP deaminase